MDKQEEVRKDRLAFYETRVRQEAQRFVEAFDALQQIAYMTADLNGWHNETLSDTDCIATLHAEVSEITEALRNRNPMDKALSNFKESEVEGADVIIRLMDWYRRKSWKLPEAIIEKMRYNTTRPYRHGGKLF